MTKPSDEEKQARRALAASLMLPWTEMASGLASDAGVPFSDLEDASDDFLIDLMQNRGLTREAMCEAVPELQRLTPEQQAEVLEYFGTQPSSAGTCSGS
jgi:hypothetical protein